MILLKMLSDMVVLVQASRLSRHFGFEHIMSGRFLASLPMANPHDLAACDSAVPDSALETDIAHIADASTTGHIPVLRPRLPAADSLLPYLRRIDANRIYANFGPLALELEARLAKHFALPENALVSASSGTAALVAAILATSGRATAARPYAFMPAFTFVATAVAAELCGYQPVLVDIDAGDWALDQQALRSHPLLAQAGVVITVAPFGRRFDQQRWQDFRRDTGIPVIIDAAAGFEAASDEPARCLGPVPVMISFHATKSFATGEGGCIACSDPDLVQRVGQALNYGFNDSRLSRTASTNGKMSEFHAATGLAELDDWPRKRTAMQSVASEYQKQMAEAGLAGNLMSAPETSSSYVLYLANDADEANRQRPSLEKADIGSRLWYGAGLREQPHVSASPGITLPVTEAISPRVIGIPTAPDLTATQIARVVGALLKGSHHQA
jgi:dTDP-4-amino-4,6-dideoxygalactose transaminase